MGRRRRSASEPLTGVTYQRRTGEILRIWYGENNHTTVLDVKQCTVYRYNSFTRLYTPLKPADVQDIKRAVQKAKTWLKTPCGRKQDKQMVHTEKQYDNSKIQN